MKGNSKNGRARAELLREARRLGVAVRANVATAKLEAMVEQAKRPVPTRTRKPAPPPRRRPQRAASAPAKAKPAAAPQAAPAPPPLPVPAPRPAPRVSPAPPRVTIVPRDPEWLYAYFRNAPDPAVLRVHDRRVHDVEVAPGTTHAFLRVTPGPVHVELGRLRPSGRFAPVATSNRVETPPAPTEPRRPLDPGAEEVHARARAALGAGSSEKLVSPGASPRPPGIGASESRHAIPSSPGAGPIGEAAPSAPGGERARAFFLEVDTELVLWGRTMPGSEVTLRGERLELRPDGTFSIRMALPSGVHDLDVRATSPDRVETRGVDVRVTRDLRELSG
jgi:uncharacterized protein